MTMHSVYILWILLPVWYLLYGIWAYAKRFGRRPVKEHPEEYFIPGFYTAAALALAIWIDQTVYEDFVNTVTMGFVDVVIARWLLYPGILLIFAYASALFIKKPANNLSSAQMNRSYKR